MPGLTAAAAPTAASSPKLAEKGEAAARQFMKIGKIRDLPEDEMTYQAVFERANDGSVFAYVPGFPGCTSWGATLSDARYHVRDAVRLWLAVAREGDPKRRLGRRTI